MAIDGFIIDLAQSVGLMSPFWAEPRGGPMMAVFQIFGCVWSSDIRSKTVFDHAHCAWSFVDWVKADWKEFYPDEMEPIPVDMP